MTALSPADEVRRVVQDADGPGDQALEYAGAYARQYAAPDDQADRVGELALAYEAGKLAGLEERL